MAEASVRDVLESEKGRLCEQYYRRVWRRLYGTCLMIGVYIGSIIEKDEGVCTGRNRIRGRAVI
jgi:hypothetical protein